MGAGLWMIHLRDFIVRNLMTFDEASLRFTETLRPPCMLCQRESCLLPLKDLKVPMYNARRLLLQMRHPATSVPGQEWLSSYLIVFPKP